VFRLRWAHKSIASTGCVLALTISLPGFCSAATAQQENPAQSNPPTQASPSSPTSSAVQAGAADQADASGRKFIRDETEYKAYVAAANTEDPKERAEALESFVQQYPKSVVAPDALEQALSAWQAAGDAVKVLEVAKELLQADSGNVRALAIIVALDRLSAAQGDSAALDELCLYSTAGMREISMWQKPSGMADADFAALNKHMTIIFNSAAGYCALQQRNFSQARDWYGRAIEIDHADLQNIYQLAIADLEMTPTDVNGFWYCARAIQLTKSSSHPQAAAGMEAYCKPKYETYHGSTAGWDSIVSLSAAQPALPPDFAKGITPAPVAPSSPPAQK